MTCPVLGYTHKFLVTASDDVATWVCDCGLTMAEYRATPKFKTWKARDGRRA